MISCSANSRNRSQCFLVSGPERRRNSASAIDVRGENALGGPRGAEGRGEHKEGERSYEVGQPAAHAMSEVMVEHPPGGAHTSVRL